jgi:putative intracellular protease/amidase
MRDTVYVWIFDGYADWQLALALCEIRRPGEWRLRTLAAAPGAVTSMGGLRVLPDDNLTQWEPERAALLLLPGGYRGAWTDPALQQALRLAHAAGATLAAIGQATQALRLAGLLEVDPAVAPGEVAHVSINQAQRVIAASGMAYVEFARAVIAALGLYDAGDTAHWYRLFKHARPLPWPHAAAVSA